MGVGARVGLPRRVMCLRLLSGMLLVVLFLLFPPRLPLPFLSVLYPCFYSISFMGDVRLTDALIQGALLSYDDYDGDAVGGERGRWCEEPGAGS